MKKKIIAMLLLAAMLLCIVSCGEQVDPRGMGTFEGKKYTNTALGLSFTAPEDWHIYNKSEIASELGVTEDDETLAHYEFSGAAKREASNAEMWIFSYNGDGAKDPLGQYVAGFRASMAEDMGDVHYTLGDETTVKLGRVKFVRIPLLMSVYGVEMQKYYYFAYLKDQGLIVNVIITPGPSTTAEMIEGMFAKK